MPGRRGLARRGRDARDTRNGALGRLRAAALAACLILAGSHAAAQTVLAEAEGFEKLGGWVVDCQFMDQMGSPYLLAHGMGRPVQEASTRLAVPGPGRYRMFVRTRDWAAPWKAPASPGRFKVLVDGKPLAAEFGAAGADWAWQDGGEVNLDADEVVLALRDLTGFDGRCDAIVLTRDAHFTPPDEPAELIAFRRKALGLPDVPPSAGRFDLVVVGGGMSGVCTAVSAARLGLKVALVQDRPVLGGPNSSEIRIQLAGDIGLGPYRHLGEIVSELAPAQAGNVAEADAYQDDKKLAVVAAEKNILLLLNTRAIGVAVRNGRIESIDAKDVRTGKELRLEAPLFADCTGDGTIGFLAGAEYRVGREGRDQSGEPLAPPQADAMVMGCTNPWLARRGLSNFPLCPWAIPFTAATCQRVAVGSWDWESGFDSDVIRDGERIRDLNLRAVYGNWAFQKNDPSTARQYERHELAWVGYVLGKRESRRLVGDVVLSQLDIQEARPFEDACVAGSWSIDLHYPLEANVRAFPDSPFRSRTEQHPVKPYAIPYRCLYSRNISNLLMAGRNISVTHVALGSTRVMRTCGMMGEAIGRAAAVCIKNQCAPRQVHADHLDELKALLATPLARPR